MNNGEPLKRGIVVRTGKESRVGLAFVSEGITLGLLDDSTISFGKLVSEKIHGEVVCDVELGLFNPVSLKVEPIGK